MRRIISYVVFLLPLWLMFGCREHGNLEKKDGEGWLSVEFLTDKSLVTRAENAKYRLEILQADGTLVAAYDNCAEMSERILLRKGTYRWWLSPEKERGQVSRCRCTGVSRRWK